MLHAPFSYFGGKRRAAPVVNAALGQITSYIEPFCGSAAVLLSREPVAFEAINDADASIANFWRSVRTDPAAVRAEYERPRVELEISPLRTVYRRDSERLLGLLLDDPDYCDPVAAGRFAWLSAASMGSPGGGFRSTRSGPHRAGYEPHYVDALAERLRRVDVRAGDWSRSVSTPWLTRSQGCVTGVFLDPPYGVGDVGKSGPAGSIYARVNRSGSLPAEVWSWAVEHGSKPLLRIVVAGYADDRQMPDGWTCLAYGRIGGVKAAAHRGAERLWLSPACDHDAAARVANLRA